MMGLKEWIDRKKEEARVKNQAVSDARKEFYTSEEYKTVIKEAEKQKIKDGKGSDFSAWIKRVSAKAAGEFNNERISVDMDKLVGKKKKEE